MSAKMCEVTLEERSYARTHTTTYYSTPSRIDVDVIPWRVAMSDTTSSDGAMDPNVAYIYF